MKEGSSGDCSRPNLPVKMVDVGGGGSARWRNLSGRGLSISLQTKRAVKPSSSAGNQHSIHSRGTGSSIISRRRRPRSQEQQGKK